MPCPLTLAPAPRHEASSEAVARMAEGEKEVPISGLDQSGLGASG